MFNPARPEIEPFSRFIFKATVDFDSYCKITPVTAEHLLGYIGSVALPLAVIERLEQRQAEVPDENALEHYVAPIFRDIGYFDGANGVHTKIEGHWGDYEFELDENSGLIVIKSGLRTILIDPRDPTINTLADHEDIRPGVRHGSGNRYRPTQVAANQIILSCYFRNPEIRLKYVRSVFRHYGLTGYLK